MTDTAWADFRETHLSAVFMAGDYVIKFKKPVRTDFVDLSSLAARDDFCEAEVRLNSRLSPDVYVGVARIGLTDRGPGEPVVVMRRLHDHDQLAQRLLAHEPLPSAALRAVAREIAAFHSRCDVDTSQDSPGSWESVRAAWLRECAELDQLAEGVTDASTRTLILQLGLRYLDGRQALLDVRVSSGQVREGHGDLRCEHVYLTSRGVRILDCVEFDRSLRVADVISDVAFLDMDLERLGGNEPASALLEWYTEFSAEVAPRSLLDFYVAHRALVRAKVAAIRAEQDGRVSPDIGRYVALALAHLRAAIPVVVCIGDCRAPARPVSAERSPVTRMRFTCPRTRFVTVCDRTATRRATRRLGKPAPTPRPSRTRSTGPCSTVRRRRWPRDRRSCSTPPGGTPRTGSWHARLRDKAVR